MEQIIDVEYRELTDLENKTTEELASETNLLYSQSEAMANMALMTLAQAGQRLKVIKSRLKHGEWEDWCAENLKFSKSKAEKVMALASRMLEENSVFSKTEMFTDIGISKVYALLGAPEEVAEEVLQNPEISEMTVKELKEEIRQLKAEMEQVENAHKASLEESSAAEESLRLRIKELEADLQNREATDPAELEAKETELQSIKDQLAKEKEKAKSAKEKADKEKGEAIYNAKRQAEKEAKKKFDEETEILRTSNQQAAEEIDRLQKQLKNSQNTELIEFNLKFRQLNVDYNECMSTIHTIREGDPDKAEKMKTALRMAMEEMIGELKMSGIGKDHNNFNNCRGCTNYSASPDCRKACEGYKFRMTKNVMLAEGIGQLMDIIAKEPGTILNINIQKRAILTLEGAKCALLGDEDYD